MHMLISTYTHMHMCIHGYAHPRICKAYFSSTFFYAFPLRHFMDSTEILLTLFFSVEFTMNSETNNYLTFSISSISFGLKR